MNIGRVILGGIVGGVIINVVEYVVHGLLRAEKWKEAIRALKGETFTLGIQAWVVWWIIGFALGIALAWLYAAIRPRYGPGPKTAIWASLWVWIVYSLFSTAGMWPMKLFPTGLALTALGVSLVEIIVAGLVAGYLYREAAPAAA